MLRPIHRACAFALALAPLAASATSTVRLPASACSAVPVISADGFEDPGAPALGPTDPSLGLGGFAGDSSGTVNVPSYGTGAYYAHVPPGYDPLHPMPVVIALHGASGSHALALSAAQQLRTEWTPLADANGFIVIAPVSNHPQGGYYPPASSTDNQQDYGIIAGALLDVESRYNVERARVYGWGFSAGGHVMHDLAINGFNATVNANTLAAYGVNAGLLSQLACRGLTAAQCGTLLAAMPRQVPADIHVGVSDSPYVYYARDDYQTFLGQNWADLFYTEFNGGHTYTAQNLAEVWGHVCGFAVAP